MNKQQTNCNDFKNPFKSSLKSNNYEKVKFHPKNPKSAADFTTSRYEVPTPWGDFKQKFIESEREIQNAKSINVNTSEAKAVLLQREQNCRRNMIDSKLKEKTYWEHFSEPSEQKQSTRKSLNVSMKFDDCKKKYHKLRRGNDLNSKSANQKNLLLAQKESLNFKQKNTLRKLLTKATITAKGTSLSNTIKDIKRSGAVRSSKRSVEIN